MGFVKGRNVELLSLFPEELTYYISALNFERGFPVKD